MSSPPLAWHAAAIPLASGVVADASVARPVLSIKRIGNVGNQMLQLVVAHSLSARTRRGIDVVGYDLPMWELARGIPSWFPRRVTRLRRHLFDFELAARLLDRGVVREMSLRGLGFRCENYLPPAKFAQLFQARVPVDGLGYGDDSLVINVRGDEVLRAVHVDYGPLPIGYYRTLIEASGREPVFVGQIGDDYYSAMLRAAFPDAEFQPSRGPAIDFEILRRSRHIAVGISTFSWIAAWLSDASTIHLPLLGMLNPAQRPEINLLPLGDARYRFWGFPLRQWSASDEQRRELAGDGGAHPLERAELDALLARAEVANRTARLRLRIGLAAQAYFNRAVYGFADRSHR